MDRLKIAMSLKINVNLIFLFDERTTFLRKKGLSKNILSNRIPMLFSRKEYITV